MSENPSPVDDADEQPVPDPDPESTAKADEDDAPDDPRRHRNAEGLEVSTEDT